MNTKQEKYMKGKLLISNSSIIKDYFNKTVILVVDHDESGAFGLVINKASDLSLRDVVKDLPPFEGDEKPVFSGGPVDQSYISILYDNPEFADLGGEVISGVYIGRSYDLLIKLIHSQSRFHLFQGYSGWSSGQLEAEFDKLSWVVHEAKKETIFIESDAESVWKNSLIEKGGLYKYYVEHTKDPMLN